MGFVVRARGQLQSVAGNAKAAVVRATRSADQRVGEGFTSVDVRRAKSAHRGVGYVVFDNHRVAQSDVHRRLVDVCNADGEGRLIEQSTCIRRPHPHRVAALGFVVRARGQIQSVAGNAKAAVVRATRSADQRVSEGVTLVPVRRAESANCGVGRVVFGNRRGAQSNIRRSLI